MKYSVANCWVWQYLHPISTIDEPQRLAVVLYCGMVPGSLYDYSVKAACSSGVCYKSIACKG